MSKSRKIIYWVATLWLALGMTVTAVVQIMGTKGGAGDIDTFTHLGFPPYMLAFIGVAKILGVVAVLAPKFPIVKEWAYAGFFFLMAGAVFSHVVMHDSASVLFGPGLLLALTVASWWLRPASRKAAAANT